jgi:hypothetical protein
MNIAVDFDDTYTRDPQMWDAFIGLALKNGHNVYCVTARAHTQDEQVLGSIGQMVGRQNCYFTAMQGKRAYMWANKIRIDVWIDDMPDMIVNGIEHVNDGHIILP